MWQLALYHLYFLFFVGLVCTHCTQDPFFTTQKQYWQDANTKTMPQPLQLVTII